MPVPLAKRRIVHRQAHLRRESAQPLPIAVGYPGCQQQVLQTPGAAHRCESSSSQKGEEIDELSGSAGSVAAKSKAAVAEVPVRVRGPHANQNGNHPEHHRLRSHRGLQQTLHLAVGQWTTRRLEVNLRRHAGCPDARQLQGRDRFVHHCRLQIPLRVPGWTHRGRAESLHQGTDRGAANSTAHAKSRARARGAQHLGIPLRVLVRARAQPLEIPEESRSPEQQGPLSGPSLSGDLSAARRIRAVLSGAEDTVQPAGIPADESSGERG